MPTFVHEAIQVRLAAEHAQNKVAALRPILLLSGPAAKCSDSSTPVVARCLMSGVRQATHASRFRLVDTKHSRIVVRLLCCHTSTPWVPCSRKEERCSPSLSTSPSPGRLNTLQRTEGRNRATPRLAPGVVQTTGATNCSRMKQFRAVCKALYSTIVLHRLHTCAGQQTSGLLALSLLSSSIACAPRRVQYAVKPGPL